MKDGVKIMMNKYKSILLENFSTNKKTLKELSEDTKNKKYMTESNIEAYDFDIIKEKYEENNNCNKNGLCSVDAILFNKDTLLLIEFKNGQLYYNEKYKDLDSEDKLNRVSRISNIKYKIRDSILILGHITNTNLDFYRQNVIFILVYNQEKNTSKIAIQQYVNKKANRKISRFGLDRLENAFFKEVYTLTEKEFDLFLGNKKNSFNI